MDQDEPQKPKPIIEGNPSLKIQTRSGAKQVGKNVGNKNVDATSDSDPVDSNRPVSTGDEYAPAEIALGNDLVLETLFRYVNRSDLLSCRVVNKQWQDEATKELRRRNLFIKFTFRCLRNGVNENIALMEVFRRLSECRAPSLLSSLQGKTVALNGLESAGVRRYLSTIGNQMRHLTLHLNYWRKKFSFKESTLMADLQNLLFRQAPNVEFLEIEFNFPDHWKDELEAFDSSDHHQNGNNEFGLLPNLKTFVVRGSPPAKFFADVINAAVNLKSLGGEFRPACFKYLIGAEGRTKIHLIKSLSFEMAFRSWVGWNQLGLELVKTFLRENKEHLKLETFECASLFLYEDDFFAPPTDSVVNQILECSSGSLLKLRIDPAQWSKELLIIPRLPKLQEICFDCNLSWREWLNGGDGFFPPGFNMNNTFPNISSIVLVICSAPLFRLVVNCMRIEMAEPVPSILFITFVDEVKADPFGVYGSSLPTMADFRHVFPNLVSITYVNSDN